MTGDYLRYAIWWVPQEATPLSAFGKRWMGWCAEDGDSISMRKACDLPTGADLGCCEVAARGLHGTLADSFGLGHGRSVWRLQEAMAKFAATSPTVPLPRLEVRVQDSRVVMAPVCESGMLHRLQGRVADIVRMISGAEAPTAPHAGPCVAGGIRLPVDTVLEPTLVTPFVVPLSGRMPAGEARRTAMDLQRRLAPVLSVPARIADLALMGDPGRGRRWRLLERFRLADEGLSARARTPAGMVCPEARPLPPLNTVMGSSWDTVIA